MDAGLYVHNNAVCTYAYRKKQKIISRPRCNNRTLQNASEQLARELFTYRTCIVNVSAAVTAHQSYVCRDARPVTSAAEANVAAPVLCAILRYCSTISLYDLVFSSPLVVERRTVA